MKHTYKTEGVCPSQIEFDLDGNVIRNVAFSKGCEGNLKALSSFADGLTVEQLENKVKGITCGRRQTSCADQLAKAVRKAYEETK